MIKIDFAGLINVDLNCNVGLAKKAIGTPKIAESLD
jgi:hypothetical protein